jgi:membrane protein implicated in regulation of membrane protease activity
MFLVFLALGLVGLLLLFVSVFTGHDLDLDADVHAGAPGFLSLRTLGVFLTGFGAVGAVAGLYGGVRPLWASTLGASSGVVLSAIYLLAMRLIQSQEASSLVTDKDLVGLEGRVSVPIPPDGVGEVTCAVGAQMTRRMARAQGRQAVAEGSRVKIMDVYGATVVVEEIR